MSNSNAFSERIVSNKVMIANIKANQERLTPWGISAEYVAKMETLYTEIQSMDNQHEALKAQLKTMTADLDGKMEELETMFRNAKKVIKIQEPKEAWVGYGFTAQK
ncbi:MAG TPA: hypothetical protein VHR47_13925 [Bacillota bacterium]|nr:hypothetical protein [Bacillota bacterium]